MKSIVVSALFCGVLMVSHPLQAQQKQHTLGDLWLQVEDYYPGVHYSQARIEAAKYQAAYTKTNRLPQVNAQLQNTYSTYNGTSGAFFALPGLFNVAGAADAISGSTVVPNSYGSATLDWEMLTFGKHRKEQESANVLLEKAGYEKEAYLLQLRKELSERYITLLNSQALLDWKTKNVKRLAHISTITAGLSSAGLRPAADSLLAHSTYTQAQGEVFHLEGERQANMLRVLELFGGTTLAIQAASQRFMQPMGVWPNDAKQRTALHPSLLVLEKESDYYALAAQVEQKKVLPSVHVLGGYAFRGTGIGADGVASSNWSQGFRNAHSNFIAGIGVTWNMTNLYRSGFKKEQLQKESERVQFQKTQHELALATGRSAAEVKIVKQYAQFQKSRDAVRQAQDAYTMYLARYTSGLIPLSELLQVQVLLEQAEANYIAVSRTYWWLLVQEAELTGDFNFLFSNL